MLACLIDDSHSPLQGTEAIEVQYSFQMVDESTQSRESTLDRYSKHIEEIVHFCSYRVTYLRGWGGAILG